MKKNLQIILILGLIITFPCFCLYGQVSINNDNSPPDSSAMLDVKSTNCGVLIPRISAAARDLIPSPAIGLLIYNTTTNKFNYYNGFLWYKLETTFISSIIGTLNIGGGVSINTSPNLPPENSAILTVNNPTRGILIPRTTPNLITTPSIGLIIYNTNANLFCYYDGTQWITLCAVSTGIAGANGSQTSIGLAIKTDNSSPHPSAMLDVSATDKGVLIPRLTNAQRDMILPLPGLVIYNTSANDIEFYNGSAWYQLISCTFTCGSPITINHVTSGGVAPIDKTVTYNTIINIPGEHSKCWITSNLGADHLATAVNDATEASAGWYWQFNRKQGYKHDGTTRTPNTTWITSITEDLDWEPANDPCTIELGSGWRIPTSTEWTNVDASGNWTNWNGPWNSALKLHAAGILEYNDGSLTGRGSLGFYWSRTQSSEINGWRLAFSSSACNMLSMPKTYGWNLRCIKGTITPVMTTTQVSSITLTSAISGGNVTFDGGALVIARGVCWSTSANPTTANNHTIDGIGNGTFVSNITGLTPNTVYYVKAYATNSEGTAYGNQVNFSTLCGGGGGSSCTGTPTVTYEGQTYNTVQIGSQCWLKENLNVGTMINGNTGQTNNNQIEKYCYNNDLAMCANYGGLYQWDEIMQYTTQQAAQGVCPAGWHIPTHAEWVALTDFLGGESVAGGKMKEQGACHWVPPNTGATNESGFTALPGGLRDYISGNFGDVGEYGLLWSSSEETPGVYPYCLGMGYNQSGAYNTSSIKTNGFSVRCLKN